MPRLAFSPAVVLIAIAAVAPGCNDILAGSSSPIGPRLISPAPGERFLQNDPSTGCEPDPARGYGHRLSFDWEELVDAVAYHLIFVRGSASIPLVSITVDSTAYAVTSCRGFVVDRNLGGWTWRVGAIIPSAGGGLDTLWSESRASGFTSCRLADGRPCNSP